MRKKILLGIIVSAVILGAAAAVCFAQTPKPTVEPGEGSDKAPANDEVSRAEATMPTEARFVGAASETGPVRDHNEDSYGVFRDAGVYLVADGMGGHAAGEVASAMAVEYIGKYMSSPLHNIFRKAMPQLAVAWLETAYRVAHEAILKRSRMNRAERGMGTTAVSVLTTPAGVWVVNLGDSRCYRIRDGKITQISHDHSLVQQLIDEGQLRTPEEIARFPYKNIITRVMGTDGDSESETFYDAPQKGDIYLLCSDGLTNEVEEQQIVEIVGQHGEAMQEAAQALVDTAKANGGHDNITVVLVMM